MAIIPAPHPKSSAWTLAGNATYVYEGLEPRLRLTEALNSQAGRAVYATALSGSVTIQFNMFIGEGSAADGFLWTIFDASLNAPGALFAFSTVLQGSSSVQVRTWSGNPPRIEFWNRPTSAAATLVSSVSYSTARGDYQWKIVITDTGSNTCTQELYKAGTLVASQTGMYLPTSYYLGVSAQTGGATDKHVMRYFTSPPADANFRDNFADAQEIDRTSQTWTNTGFMSEANEPAFAANRSAWAKITGPANVSLDTIGSVVDTQLAVYSGSALAGLSLIASDDNSGGGTASKVLCSVPAGSTYYVQAGSSAAGAMVVNLGVQGASLLTPGIVTTRSKTAWLYKGRPTRVADSGSVV